MEDSLAIDGSLLDTQDTGDGNRVISRIARACERCRLRKIRCDGSQPCSRCQEQQASCLYRPGKPRTRKQYRKLHWANQQPRPATQSEQLSPTIFGMSAQPDPQTSESPSNSRPNQWRESLRAGTGVSDSRTGAFQFYGPSSHFTFVQRIYERLNNQPHDPSASSPASPIPDGVRTWGLESFLFSAPEQQRVSTPKEAFISRNMGERFIRNYFKIVHPQLPILMYSDVMSQWASFCEPPSRHSPPRDRRIVYMVLALGARVSPCSEKHNLELTNGWAEYFLSKTDVSITVLSEPTMHMVQFFLLKAAYAQQLMRPNETYLYLGYASRTATSLGINRAPTLSAPGLQTHQMRLTFWVMFATEKITALLVGRPSSLRDDQIDAPYPCEQPQFIEDAMRGNGVFMHGHGDSIFVRIMVEIGKLADKILVGIYSLEELTAEEQYLIEQRMVECEAVLESISKSLPSHLNFMDEESAVGEDWQEMQRLNIGLVYYSMRMLIHRPVMVFATFFPSNFVAQLHAPGVIQLQQSISASVTSARSIIMLARDSFFTRQPDARYDGSLASYIVAACITLLYEVLDPANTVSHAKETFTCVELAIQCLDTMTHLGPQTGKKMSVDIMNMAKNAFFSSPRAQAVEQSLIDEFPWLRATNQPIADTSVPTSQTSNAATQELRSWVLCPEKAAWEMPFLARVGDTPSTRADGTEISPDMPNDVDGLLNYFI